MNTFRTSGIYPVDRHAINPKKLEPSKVYTATSEPSSSSSDTSCPIKPGVGASKLALKALEEELEEATTCLFNRRFEEGYDLTDDALYTTWAKLKRATQPLTDITNTARDSNPAPGNSSTSVPSLPTSNTSRLLGNVLKVPERQHAKNSKTTTRGTARLPKHLSGEEMVRFLEERRMQKIREVEEKEEKKAAREAKKKQKEEEKKQKEREKKQREEEKKQREEEKKQREEEKKQKAAKKASQKCQKQKTGGSGVTPQQQQQASHTTDSTVCPVCDGIYEEEGEDSTVWVEYIGCEE